MRQGNRILIVGDPAALEDVDTEGADLEVRVQDDARGPVTRAIRSAAREGFRAIGLLGVDQARFGGAEDAGGTLRELFQSLQDQGVVLVNCTARDLSPIPFVQLAHLVRADGLGPLRAAFLGKPRLVVEEHARWAHARLDETRIIRALLKDHPPGFMIDVGAHHGSALLPFAKTGWQVLAFEPDETNRQSLLERMPSGLQVEIEPVAVADVASGGRAFYASPESTGISSLTPFTGTHSEVGSVPVTTLTEVCRARGIDRVDFLKIDTEGFDLMVLRGFPWATMSPAVVTCEFEDRKTVPLGYGFHDLAQFLVDRGYQVLVSEWHPVQRYGISHDWCRLAHYPVALKTNRAWGNLLAFRNEVLDEVLQRTARAALKTTPEPPPAPAVHARVLGAVERHARSVRRALHRARAAF